MTGHTTDGTLGGRTSRNRYLKQASEASPGYIRGDRLLVKTAQTAAMPPKNHYPEAWLRGASLSQALSSLTHDYSLPAARSPLGNDTLGIDSYIPPPKPEPGTGTKLVDVVSLVSQ
jgi:hypothetical protein